ncbi:hypothetical protein LU699_08710 [Luteimonas fraxinea]|uniref:Uncharacterized protein n=1 Tax=Luteimonas fraxinea TaxID=2901869 RepID=A0ABS8UDE8_9GAMM|nr:hypothetical protein [Luteimonas fraxinea]MCD9097512.1 hypothetical protein [Luteimonas fraxinea]UHH11762.1 hypothetical protein LU699_08710 [Luteimonas fraxinea]
MDPLTAATSFATIVGLLSNFKSERSGNQLSDFVEWLREKRHEDVALRIERNQALAVQLKSILALNHQELVQRLDSLDSVLASVASHVGTFSNLATSVRPSTVLSAQAISIVKQFVASGANECWERKVLGPAGTRYHFIGGSDGLQIDEPRFVEDDLDTLVEFGILRLDYGSKGTRKFIITRQAVQLANSA